MKVTENGILFEDLARLNGFYLELRLQGILKFAEPVEDNTGNILIKEDVYVKESFFEKLKEMSGSYRAHFLVPLTDELITKISEFLVRKLGDLTKAGPGHFLTRLLDLPHHRPDAYMRSAFRNKSIALSAYRIYRDNDDFFTHLCELGLLNMAIVMQKYLKVRGIHKNAFLSGFLSDLPLAGQSTWKEPSTDIDQVRSRARKAAEMADRLRVAPEVSASIAEFPQGFPIPDFPRNNIPDGEAGTFSAEHLENLTSSPVEEEQLAEQPMNEQAREILTESLRIAHFILETKKRIEDSDFFAEEMVYRVSYNAGKGVFHDDLIQPIVRKFQEFELEARKMRRLAEIENKCIHPPSAWAYPKPRAAQILCQNHVQSCPKMVRGWDIHVISPQQAFGWLGTDLAAGEYSKCELEELLQKDPILNASDDKKSRRPGSSNGAKSAENPDNQETTPPPSEPEA
tara:strand:- start:57546 stop:58913 length:1368 start_codon:yes stop_codon:yes gene_type:complete